jgi:hypothetical protein
MIKRNKELEISKEFLDNLNYKDKHSYLILNLIYPNINFNANSKNNLPEQDHIFSQNELKTAGISDKDTNTIFNIRYITSMSNKKKLKIPFNEWIKDLTPEEKKSHLIPDGNWNITNYNDFLKARRELMLKKIKGLIE